MKTTMLGFVLAMSALAAYAGQPHVTRVPMTYTIGYKNHLNEAKADTEKILEAPPDIFHTGNREIPFNARIGPMEGEAYGLIPPDQVREKIQRIQEFTRHVRSSGVRWIIPYICNQTVFGDAEKRIGFWEFYDHWDEYSEFGLPPKPARDPIEWMQRCSNGELHTTYPFHFPMAEPGFRYQPCPNSPDWREFLKFMVRSIVRCGYNGVFVDNCILHSYDVYSQQDFDIYLKEQYGDRLKELFGTDDLSKLNLVDPQTGSSTEGYGKTGVIGSSKWTPQLALLWAETQRFWVWSVCRQLRELKETGKQESGQDFLIIPNYGTTQRVGAIDGRRQDAKDLKRYAEVSDVIMLEEGGDVGQVATGLTADYHLQYKMGLAYGAPVAVLPYTRFDPVTFEMCMAEALAGAGAAFIEMETGFPDLRARYQQFVRENLDVFDGSVSTAPIAVVFDYEQLFFENRTHLDYLYVMGRFLADRGYLFDLVTPEDSERLTQYDLVVVPNVKYVSEDVHQRITAIPSESLIIIGEYATHDEFARPKHRRLPHGTHVPTPDPLLPPRGISRDSMIQLAFRSSDLLKEGRNLGENALMHRTDQVMHVSRNDGRCRFDAIVEQAGKGRPMTVFVDDNVRPLKVNTYLKKDGTEQFAHLVNYQVPLADSSGKALETRTLQPIPNTTLQFPIRQGAAVDKVTLCSPNRSAPVELKYELVDSAILITIPEIGPYEILRIRWKS